MKTITSRLESHFVLGADIYWVPDGTKFGTDGSQVDAGPKNMPPWAEVEGSDGAGTGLGKFLGTIKSWRFNTTYKELEDSGYDPRVQRYVTKIHRFIDQVAPTFTTGKLAPEAFALLFGLSALPEQGQSAQPFSNASGSMSGWLCVQVVDSFRTTGSDGGLAQIFLHGDLRLTDTSEMTSDMSSISYELMVDEYPQDGFTNIAINASLPNT